MLNNLWIEKYRATTLDDMVLDTNVKELFDKYIKEGEIPHLLFIGAPGTGKTTLARILVKNLDAECLELNASDERGIDTVRDKIKRFAMTASYKKWKIVFCAEADGITAPAQFSLRNIMEKYANSCRFILTANYKDRIIEPIQSRLQVIEFDNLPQQARYKFLINILTKENIKYDSEDIFKILDDSEGDLRAAINILQSMVKGDTLVYSSMKDKVDYMLLWKLTKEKNWGKVREIIEDGLDTTYILDKLFFHVFENISPDTALTVLGEYVYRDSIVVNKNLNLLCALIELSKAVY